jgi:membrane protein YqaA with SNARE-associated domain
MMAPFAAEGRKRENGDRKPASRTREKDPFLRREFWLTIIFLAVLLAAVGLAGAFLHDEVTGFATWVYERLGFNGLAILFFLSEALVNPMPPDVILWIVAGSELSREWLFNVSILSVLSTAGGHAGWFFGRRLRDTGLVQKILGRHDGRSVEMTQRYGIWAVVLAALTPLPWSVTSWTAGALEMPWRHYALGSIARFPRIFLYYISIHAAFHWGIPAV